MPDDWTVGLWLSALGRFLAVEPTDNLDYAEVRLTDVPAGALAAATTGGAVRRGIRARLVMNKEPWTCQIEAFAGGVNIVSGEGIEQVFDAAIQAQLHDAIQTKDLDRLFQASNGASVDGVIYYQNTPEAVGHHWMRSGGSVRRFLSSPGRVAAARRLIDSNYRALRVDYEPIEVECRGLTIGGTGRPARMPPEVRGPAKLAPEPMRAEGPIADLLRAVVVESCWGAIFGPTQCQPGTIPTLHLEGMRTVDVPLVADPSPEEMSEALQLLDFAQSDDASDRREALVQAASVAVGAGGLQRASGAVLRTAKSLLNLSRRHLIQEAFAARRAAHDSAVAATRTSADAAIEAAYKARDRVLVQVAAGVGVAIANATKVVSHLVAAGLYVVLVSGLAVVLLMALNIDFPVAARGLDRFVADLSHYSDALDEADVARIGELESVTGAYATIAQSRCSVIILCSAVIAMVVAVAIITFVA
jgi:hypothetical protein